METRIKPLTKMQRYRAKMRAQGLRPVQIWVPDTRAPGFAEELRRQCALLRDDPEEQEILDFIDAATDWSDWDDTDADVTIPHQQTS